MLVLRKTMEAALREEMERHQCELVALASRFGDALSRVTALQQEMSAWVMNKAENITPEQAAQMFYAQDDSWQAAFFNVMQGQVKAHHDALPPPSPHELRFHPGVPAGESQWFWMAQKLADEGFETLEAMYEHAKHAREREQAA
jgi:hypothetical protein